MFRILLLVFSLLAVTRTQTSTYFYPGVPTAEPISGKYTGVYRPRVHFSPPANFMNDPSGLFRDKDGVFHLYYQYNPTQTVAGNQHWGHATSKDLYHWQNQKIALWPPTESTYVYTGSAVLDVNNTSGFFPGQDNGVVAIYTLAAYENGTGGTQDQNIAYSRDGGYTFEAYKGNPIINVNSTNFRDPKVLWHTETGKWVMVVSFSADFIIGIYTSLDLKNWTHASNFSHHGLVGMAYECPNLIEMPMEGDDRTMWVLQISVNPGAPLGGSVSQYFVGNFNGTHFTPVDGVTRLTDFSKDNYAGQFFYGIPATEKQISFGWASNWQYTDLVPTGNTEGWRSQMSVPRYQYLANVTAIGYNMFSAPYNIQSIFSQELAYNKSFGNGTILIDYSTVASGALYVEANVTGLTASTLQGMINMTFISSVSGEFVAVGSPLDSDTWVNRGHTYAFENPYFTNKFSTAAQYSGDGTWSVAAIIDHSILEVFLNGGQHAATTTFYAKHSLDNLRIDTSGMYSNVSVSIGVWALEDAWAMEANSNGTVVGNVTHI